MEISYFIIIIFFLNFYFFLEIFYFSCVVKTRSVIHFRDVKEVGIYRTVHSLHLYLLFQLAAIPTSLPEFNCERIFHFIIFCS